LGGSPTEEHFASIFRVEDYAKQEIRRKMRQNYFSQLADCLLFIFYLHFDSEGGGDKFLRNMALSPNYAAL
jgi:hypothetical protein